MTYADEVLADSPLLYLKLDETSGTTAADSSGSGRDLTGAATPGQTTVMPSGVGSWDFDGTTGDALQRSSEAWMQVNACTIEAWIDADTVTGGTFAVGGRDNDTFFSGVPRGPVLYVREGFLRTGGKDSTGTVAAGVATHVAATWSGTTVSFYINGSAAGVVSVEALRADEFDAPFVVGASYAASPSLATPFNGRIDEFAFYGSALSAARIAAHYNAAILGVPIDGTLPGLVESITLRSYTRTLTDNQAGGILIRGSSLEPVNAPDVEPVPATVSEAEMRDKAVAYTLPTMVNGRPT